MSARKIRGYLGDARGRWDGNTLVVETKNFTDRTHFGYNNRFNSEQFTLVERFTPTSAKTLQWDVTFNDPDVWTKPWTFTMPLTRDDSQQVFEYACHEGNRGLEHILSAARADERARQVEADLQVRRRGDIMRWGRAIAGGFMAELLLIVAVMPGFALGSEPIVIWSAPSSDRRVTDIPAPRSGCSPAARVALRPATRRRVLVVAWGVRDLPGMPSCTARSDNAPPAASTGSPWSAEVYSTATRWPGREVPRLLPTPRDRRWTACPLDRQTRLRPADRGCHVVPGRTVTYRATLAGR